MNVHNVHIDMDMIIISIYNNCVEGDSKISFNDEDFFSENFENSYDAAWAVSVSGKWHWSDDFVYFDEDGYLTSFTHWDDKNSPIDVDKLDLSKLIKSLENKNKKDR